MLIWLLGHYFLLKCQIWIKDVLIKVASFRFRWYRSSLLDDEEAKDDVDSWGKLEVEVGGAVSSSGSNWSLGGGPPPPPEF